MPPPDLEALSEDYPEWVFCAPWVESNSGPDRRAILARRKSDGLLVGGLTPHEVRAKIIREDEAQS
jgi:hypothetical protein